jgi:transcription elongation factor Elf1
MNINNVGVCACCNAQHGSNVSVHLTYMQYVNKFVVEVCGMVYRHGESDHLHNVDYFDDASAASRHFNVEVNSHK